MSSSPTEWVSSVTLTWIGLSGVGSPRSVKVTVTGPRAFRWVKASWAWTKAKENRAAAIPARTIRTYSARFISVSLLDGCTQGSLGVCFRLPDKQQQTACQRERRKLKRLELATGSDLSPPADN
jgi:hypothetical protein